MCRTRIRKDKDFEVNVIIADDSLVRFACGKGVNRVGECTPVFLEQK